MRAGDPVMSATVDVTNAGRPIAAPHAESSMSTTGRGHVLAQQSAVERIGHGEIARDDFNGRRQPCRIRPPRERAHRHACVHQFIHHQASDAAGGAGYEERQVCPKCLTLTAGPNSASGGAGDGLVTKAAF